MLDKGEWVPLKHLTKVIRNSQCIMEYASEHHENGSILFDMGHDFKGEHVIERSYWEGYQISTLRAVIKSLYSEGYNAGDITFIYGNKESYSPKS